MFPKRGNELHGDLRGASSQQIASAIGDALRGELGSSHRATKAVMRWTGASDRSAKNWIGGTHIPSAGHLILLARHSDAVMAAVMILARRDHLVLGPRLRALQVDLANATIAIDGVLRGQADERRY